MPTVPIFQTNSPLGTGTCEGILADMKARRPSKRWQEIAELKISPEEIIYLVQEMTRMHDEEKEADFYTSIAILGERYRGQEDSVDRMFCITTRMQCLSELTKDERMHGWTMETNDPKCTLTNGAVFHAVALCTLHVDDDHFYFDPDEFFRVALEEVEPEGHA